MLQGWPRLPHKAKGGGPETRNQGWVTMPSIILIDGTDCRGRSERSGGRDSVPV
jgi:hypothetical protein